ncbi:MAG TPA: cation-translocating P-type ATPase, partial [Verrucomicrobiae bacterium]|nr:cation-translocating P-type ATPase [Verrucomicrobiae bacterium]
MTSGPMIAEPKTNAAADQAPSSTELAISGMTCANCARHVTEALQSVPEVSTASVRLDAGRATVRWTKSPNLPAAIAAVEEAGYEAKPLEQSKVESAPLPLSGWRFNVVVGLVCTLPLIIGEWVFGLGMQAWFRWLAFILASVVQVFCGARFYVGAWRQLKRGSSNMDTLVALGSTTAFGYSVWALFATPRSHLYFMEAAAIITLISLGHWFEARTTARAESSLQALLRLAPPLARRQNPNGSESEVPVASLQAGDLVVLKPGDRVPVDGEILEGNSTVDEAMLTGESNPVDKVPEDELYAGTINLNGRLLMRVTATGEATALAHIIAAVQRAQNSRAEIQRLGDRVSEVFVPLVVIVALATALWWGLAPDQAQKITELWEKYLWPVTLPSGAVAAAFIHAAAVLIVACPCAMGLATPVAIMAGTNAAARRGILIRDGVALEKAGRITTLVFDKTGTLTQGKPVVVKMEAHEPSGPQAILPGMKLAAALARRSNHPVSQAVARLDADYFPFADWQEIRGGGVQARLSSGSSQSETVRLGSLRWLRESGVDFSRGRDFEEKWSAAGATVLGLAI